MTTKNKKLLAALAALMLGTTMSQAQVNFDWATVGDINNPNDVTGYGSVSYEYKIATKEVNLFQYTAFLNAVDPNGLNTYGLYTSSMSSLQNIAGISYTAGAASGSKYAVIGSGLRPVTLVSWNDAARFVNWVQNGQGSGSTETGVYDMSFGTPVRSESATYWIPSDNEWYKAAYYDPSVSGPTDDYWLYPTRSDSAPGNVIGAGVNQANFNNGVYSVSQSGSYSSSQNYITDGGAFTNSASFYGTYDQGGNVYEWNDTDYYSNRHIRGGSWADSEINMQQSTSVSMDPSYGSGAIGFRVASVPEPSTMALLGLVGAGWLAWRRRRATL